MSDNLHSNPAHKCKIICTGRCHDIIDRIIENRDRSYTAISVRDWISLGRTYQSLRRLPMAEQQRKKTPRTQALRPEEPRSLQSSHSSSRTYPGRTQEPVECYMTVSMDPLSKTWCDHIRHDRVVSALDSYFQAQYTGNRKKGGL